MARILVTCAGGRLAVAYTRGLNNAPEPFDVVGVDGDVYGLQRSRTRQVAIVPRATDPSYIDRLNQVIDEHEIDLLLVQLEAELLPISASRDQLHAPVFLPRHETMLICDSKWASYDVWSAAGVAVPKSILINSKEALKSALDELGGKMWLRSLTGAGGKGSLPVTTYDQAVNWVNMWNGWGSFMAAELLTRETSSWESIWDHGKLVVAQVRKRHRWEFSSISMSGVTGITGISETVDDPVVQRLSLDAVLAVDPEPHGIMGVDVAFDEAGNPKVTEINPGRFMSGGVILFAEHGFNFPYAATKTALGQQLEDPFQVYNPLPDGLVCVRGLDVEPVITTRKKIDSALREYESQMLSLTRQRGVA